MSEEPTQSPAAAEAVSDFVSPPMYFPVSVVKLAVMSTFTFGIYELFWFYQNWCMVRDRERSDIVPFGRMLFAPLFCYSLLKKMEATAESQRIRRSIEAGPLAAGWIIFTLLARLPDPYWLISFIAVGYLLPVQAAVNEINRVTSPMHDPNRNFTVWNILGIVIGSLFLALVLIGTFFHLNDGLALGSKEALAATAARRSELPDC
jgi:hypothetical protein